MTESAATERRPSPCVTPAGRARLEALRVLAIAMLVAYHAACVWVPHDPSLLARLLLRAAGMGWIGTDLALGLSGFLAFESRARAGSAGRWLVHRALRVLPAYWTFLLSYLYGLPALLAAAGVVPTALSAYRGLNHARQQLPYIGALTTNWLFAAGGRPGAALEPLLTLALGVQLTLLAACVIRERTGQTWALAGGLWFLGILLHVLWLHADPWRSYSLPFTRCDSFLAGLSLAAALREPRVAAQLLRWRGRLLALGSFALAAAALLTHGLVVESPTTVLLGYPAIGLFTGALVLVLAQQREASSLSSRVALLGPHTYGAYLWKLPLLWLITDGLRANGLLHGTGGVLLLITASLLASFWAGSLWYLAIERPLQRLTSRLL